MILPIIAGAVALAMLTRRPSGRSGAAVADGTSTVEGQQNRNFYRRVHGGARSLKATRNCGGPGSCSTATFQPYGINMVRTGGPVRNCGPGDCGSAQFRRLGFSMVRIDPNLIPQ